MIKISSIFYLILSFILLISPAYVKAEIDLSFCYDSYGNSRDWTAGCIKEQQEKQKTIGGFTPVTGQCWNNPATSANECEVGEAPPDIQSSASEECYQAWDGTTVCPIPGIPNNPNYPSQQKSPSASQRQQTERGTLPNGEIGPRAGCYTGETTAECQIRKANESSAVPLEQPRQTAPFAPASAKPPKVEQLPTGQREFRSLQSGQKIYKPKDVLQFDNTLRSRANKMIKEKAAEAAKKASITAEAQKKLEKSESGTQIQPGAFQGFEITSTWREVFNKRAKEVLDKIRGKTAVPSESTAPEKSAQKSALKLSKSIIEASDRGNKEATEFIIKAGEGTTADIIKRMNDPKFIKAQENLIKQIGQENTGEPVPSQSKSQLKPRLLEELEKELKSEPASSLQPQSLPTGSKTESGLKSAPTQPTSEGIKPFESTVPAQKTLEPESKLGKGELKEESILEPIFNLFRVLFPKEDAPERVDVPVR